MVHTVVAYFENVACDGLDFVNALADQHVTYVDDDITIPEMNAIMGVHCLGTGIIDARLLSPSLRRMWNLDVFPFVGAAAKPIAGNLLMDMHENPLPLVVSEKLNLQVDNGNVANNMYGIIFLTNGYQTPEKGEIFTIKSENTTALVANTWSNQPLIFGQTLPAGRYRVVGMAYRGAGAIASRLVFVGSAWRPGCLGVVDHEDQGEPIFRHGRLGNWGEFEFDQPPSVDCLDTTAAVKQEIWLDLIQIRAGR